MCVRKFYMSAFSVQQLHYFIFIYPTTSARIAARIIPACAPTALATGQFSQYQTSYVEMRALRIADPHCALHDAFPARV